MRCFRTRRSDPEAAHAQPNRRGVTTVETAFVIMVFLTIIFGMLELSIAIFRYHVVSQGARQGARLAIVRGEFATPLGQWDPAVLGSPHTVAADHNTDVVALAVRRYLTGVDTAQTTLSVTWLAGNNDLHSPVRFRVSTTHQPFVTFLFTSNWTLVGESTMPIAH